MLEHHQPKQETVETLFDAEKFNTFFRNMIDLEDILDDMAYSQDSRKQQEAIHNFPTYLVRALNDMNITESALALPQYRQRAIESLQTLISAPEKYPKAAGFLKKIARHAVEILGKNIARIEECILEYKNNQE